MDEDKQKEWQADTLKHLNEECNNIIKTAIDPINKDDRQKELFTEILAAANKIDEANRIAILASRIEQLAVKYNVSVPEMINIIRDYLISEIVNYYEQKIK